MEPKDFVPEQDVAVDILQKKILNAKSPEDKSRSEKKLVELMESRELVRNSVRKIVEKCTNSPEHAERVWNGKSSAYSTKTYKEVVEHFKTSCFKCQDSKYETALKYMQVFANLIEEKVPVERIKGAIDEVSVSLKMDNVTPPKAEKK